MTPTSQGRADEPDDEVSARCSTASGSALTESVLVAAAEATSLDCGAADGVEVPRGDVEREPGLAGVSVVAFAAGVPRALTCGRTSSPDTDVPVSQPACPPSTSVQESPVTRMVAAL